MNKKIVVSAPGKIHLLGEHAVVYGKPALLAAIDRRCRATLLPRKDNKILVISKDFKEKMTVLTTNVIKMTESARLKWKEFVKKNEIKILKSIIKTKLNYSILAVGETLLFYNKKLINGFQLEIESEIPIGAGLGSSAAVAVSVAAAVSRFLNQSLDKKIINEIAFQVEEKMHGFPSGGDNSTACFGGLVWFRKETSDFKIIESLPFSLPNHIAQNFLIINSGQPEESTGEMISLVKDLYKNKPRIVRQFLNSQEDLTRELLTVIKNARENRLMEIIKEGERNLKSIGVVSNSVQKIIRTIEDIGGVAKICGAGGQKKGSGIILVYCKQKQKILDLIKYHRLTFSRVNLAEEGLRIENN